MKTVYLIIRALFQRIALSAAFALMLAASAMAATEPPRVSIARVDHIQMNNQGATLDVMLDVRNPTGVDLSLNSLTFQCDFDQVGRTTGSSTKPVNVPSNAHALVPVKLLVGNDSLMALINLIATGSRSVGYKLNGTAEIGPMMLDVPFTQRGRINLPH
jgi:LEA14-like dessication related protein